MKQSIFIFLLIFLTQCGGPEPRRPVEVKSGSFFKTSVERNKELLAQEEKMIGEIMASDSLNQYLSTDFGAWYCYSDQVQEDAYLPVEDDLVILEYDLLSLGNDTIYSRQEIGTITYRVDREDLFPGLRMSVKLLKEGETATFLYPSHLAYGYHGDEERIGPNVPLKSTISVLKIEQAKDSILN